VRDEPEISEREIEFLTSHLPVQIDGDPSEQIEVPNYKNLPRIETNKLRINWFSIIGLLSVIKDEE